MLGVPGAQVTTEGGMNDPTTGNDNKTMASICMTYPQTGISRDRFRNLCHSVPNVIKRTAFSSRFLYYETSRESQLLTNGRAPGLEADDQETDLQKTEYCSNFNS